MASNVSPSLSSSSPSVLSPEQEAARIARRNRPIRDTDKTPIWLAGKRVGNQDGDQLVSLFPVINRSSRGENGQYVEAALFAISSSGGELYNYLQHKEVQKWGEERPVRDWVSVEVAPHQPDDKRWELKKNQKQHLALYLENPAYLHYSTIRPLGERDLRRKKPINSLSTYAQAFRLATFSPWAEFYLLNQATGKKIQLHMEMRMEKEGRHHEYVVYMPSPKENEEVRKRKGKESSTAPKKKVKKASMGARAPEGSQDRLDILTAAAATFQGSLKV